MRLSAIFFSFGLLCLALAVAMLLPMLVALGEGHPGIATGFLSSAVFTAFVGGGFALTLSSPRRTSGVREAVGLMILAWTVLPVFAMLPAWAAGWPRDLVQAYFEAVSALTTTGATQYQADSGLPVSLLLWRSLLHWLGGFGGLVAAVAVLTGVAPMALPVQTIIVPHLGREALMARLVPVAKALAPVYGLITLVVLALLLAGGTPAFDALLLTLSAVATGGVSAQGSVLSNYGSIWLELVVIFAVVLGAMSFATHRAAWPYKPRMYLKDIEARWMLGLIIGVILIAWAYSGPPNMWPAVVTTIGLVTTSGYSHLGHGLEIPPALVCVMVLIGGSIISTAGGIKLMRIILLAKQSRRELHRLARPHGISRDTVYGRQIKPDLLEPVWIYFIALAIAVTFLSISLSLYLPSFEWAAGAAIAAISNTGPALYVAFPDAPNYRDFPDAALIMLSAGMILGRIEILALPVLLTGSFWRF